jgi:hypothetical protein
VAIALSWGIAVVPDTVNVRPFDGVPFDPFCTVTVKVPPMSATVPISCVELVLGSALFAMLHGRELVQPGPVKITVALFGSKPVPAIPNVNACALRGWFGDVMIVLSWGAPITAPDTAKVRLFDVSPLEQFCTFTLKLPPVKIATPSNSEELLANSALFAIIHVVDARPHPGY